MPLAPATRRLLDLLGIELPVIQAPMAGANGSALAIAVSEAGGLGSLPCAMLSLEQGRAELDRIRQQTGRPYNVNFFCHTPPKPDPARDRAWRQRLGAYYREHGLDAAAEVAASNRAPFDAHWCALIEEYKPAVVSFHFGLPAADLLARVKATGTRVLSSATTVAEARWLEAQGVDAVIAQGTEAGGHRGIFLSDPLAGVASQPGTFALVPQVADAVRVPVIAAGGIADGRGAAAALVLGAAAVQVGTAYLFCPEATISAVYRSSLVEARDDNTALTNVFSGRPARGIVNRIMREVGPLSTQAPEFPLAAGGIAPIRAKAEAKGSGEFTSLWSGQAATLARAVTAGGMGAAELTRKLAADAEACLQRPGG